MILKGPVYDKAKWAAQIGLPALATLYFALSQIWGLPDGAEVVGSITAIDAFLGVVLGISSKQYNASDQKYDGTMTLVVSPEDGRKTYSLELNDDIPHLDDKKEVVFKVNNTAS